MSASLHHDERVPRKVLRRHEPGRIAASAQAADAEPAALTERVTFEAAVSADHRAVHRLDRSGAGRQPRADECAEWALADEADSRRVALVRDRQAAIPGEGTHFGLSQAADRKFAERELPGVERMQEITLVFIAIRAAKQPPAGSDPRVVPGGEALGAEAPGIREPDAELDLAIAKHVRVRRASRLELGKETREHALAVFGRKARLVEGDSELVADASRVLEIRGGRAVTVFVLFPVRHEEGLDLVPGIEQERRRDCRVHSAGERDDRASHRRSSSG